MSFVGVCGMCVVCVCLFGLTNRNLILIVLEAGSPRSSCQHHQLKALFWVTDFWLYPLRAEKAMKLYWVSYESINAIHKFFTLMK